MEDSPHTILKFLKDIAVSDSSMGNSDDDEGSFFELELDGHPAKKTDLCSTTKNRESPLMKTYSHVSSTRPPSKFGFFILRSKSHKTEIKTGDRLGRLSKLNVVSNGESYPNDNESKKKTFRDCVNKYLKLIRPPFSSLKTRRSGKSNVSESSSFGSSSSTSSLFIRKKTGFGEMVKSRSVSATPIAPFPRDDSRWMHDEGIQSAIQHCKRSLGSYSEAFPHLSRSASSPCYQMTRKSY